MEKRKRTARKRLLSLRFRALMKLETVGVEDGSCAETRSPHGLRGLIYVGEHMGEHYYNLQD